MQLRQYQRDAADLGLDILKKFGVAYLALETRTGKTIIALAIAKAIGLPCLFVTKKQAIPSVLRDHEASGYGLELTVTNYEQLKNINPDSMRLIVLDEAHTCGGYPKPSLRANLLRKLTPGCPVLLLSATPTPESYSQIYHQLWCANARLPLVEAYKNFYHWAKVYVKLQTKRVAGGIEVNDYSHAHVDQIAPHLDAIMVTLTQSEAGFNHVDQYEHEVVCQLPPELTSAMKIMKKDGLVIINGWLKILGETAASRMSKIHQLCGGTVIDGAGYGRVVSAHKIPSVLELIGKHDKIAIFYKFQAEREFLETVIDGGLLASDWQEFNRMDRAVYLSQFLSGREGINLASASAIVFYNIDYAYLSYEQTRNRFMARDKQDKGHLYFLVSAGGIESEILKLVRAKKNFTSSHYQRIEGRLARGWE